MNKYVELSNRIKSELATPRAHILFGIDYALRFLDRNPGQVPGRTITVSEIEDEFARTWRMDINNDGYMDGFNAALRATGTTVVAAPEPTNAEKLARSIDLNSRGVVYLTGDEILVLAEGMDEDGVKANG